MASTAKTSKDKPIGGSPRLMPRPTAASAARAARNATNRNLTQIPVQRQSPTRASSSPATRGRNTNQRNASRTGSKTDVKVPRIENEVIVTEVNVPQGVSSVIESASVLPTEDIPSEPKEDTTELQEISENDVFEIKQEESNIVQDESEIPLRKESPRSRPETPTLTNRPVTPRSLPSSRPQTPQPPSQRQQPLSRPTTPQQPSRPTTPQPSSRPMTPRPLSRPTTPAHPAQCHEAPVSRPNTPRAQTRPNTPSPSKIPAPVPICPNKNQEDIKQTFVLKQKQFHCMKKELDLKQQAVLEVFDALQGLRERMSREGMIGSGEGHLQELVVFNVADWTAEELTQLCRDAVASSDTDGAVEIINTTVPVDEVALAELDAKVLSVPNRFANLCLQAFTSRQELIDWVKGLIENNVIKEENGDGECLERIARYNAQGLQLCEALREIKSRAVDAVDTVTQLSRQACRERSALIAVGESLVREIARLRQDIEARSTIVSGMPLAETDTNKDIEELRRELLKEKATAASNKDKMATTESQLRQARIRVTKMDRQLREAETSIASLTSTVKSLEDQSRQREVQLEARARKLKESVKTGEMTSGHLAQQRDTLQTQVNELKEQIATLTTNHKSAIQDLTNQLKDANTALEEQHRATEEEKELKRVAEAALAETQKMVEELNMKITELENSRPNPDLPTEREMDLWAELQATKDSLRITEDEVTACKREKVKFLETLTKISESENKVGMQQKLAAELLNKEEILGKMQMQIRDLTKNIKLNEQKVIQYEQYVRDLQAHNRAVANCQESPNGISYQDLQQEIMNLKMNLLEAVHHNEELSEKLVQREQQIEQQDKTSRAQARVIKVREELINMLKNKETEQSRELTVLQQDLEHRMKIVDEVNRQIAAKAEEIQELFATLENKQQQIHRLEKIVLALEEQQRRAQAQRTRHEEKIAALEHELAAGGNRRERKFLFF